LTDGNYAGIWYADVERTPMEPDDQIAEWLVRWEEAQAANQPPTALDQLPTELHARAREGLRLLRGFARMSHGLTTTAPCPRPASSQAQLLASPVHHDAVDAAFGHGGLCRAVFQQR